MRNLTGYPVVDCPECEGSERVSILGAVDPARPFGVGERARFLCTFCDRVWVSVIPEPLDDYAGDGVFAENH